MLNYKKTVLNVIKIYKKNVHKYKVINRNKKFKIHKDINTNFRFKTAEWVTFVSIPYKQNNTDQGSDRDFLSESPTRVFRLIVLFSTDL